MASNHLPLNVDNLPELAQLVDELQQTGRPRVLARNNRAVAVLVPTASARLSPALRSPRDPLAVVERTAGIFRAAVKQPPATPQEETDAFEQAIAEEVMRGAGG